MRQRVRSKLIDSRIASRKREQQAEQEIVVKAPKVEEVGFLELNDQELTEGEKRRRLASALVMIGALMGVLSGTLILQGNPSGLLNSSIFKSTDSLDIHSMIPAKMIFIMARDDECIRKVHRDTPANL